ncbi:phosducin-like protein [Bacillus rossius redtenbacheri]|uniref:phosducin-like protein n=1 Tax=Bacillus rossius redtenbacheri TaxID=93214 RepID=UPI002FDEAB77
MTTLEDKILGEKAHCYCSSSESENEKSDDETAGEEETTSKVPVIEDSAAPPEPYKWEGSSRNTGPKGVVKDWQRFKQLQVEKRAEQERERIALINKLALTCRSALEDERENTAQVDPELADLLRDDFIIEYQKKRMKEMMSQLSSLPKFGELYELKDGQEFLDAVDKDKSVTTIVHIYEKNISGCEAMNGCLTVLCQEYINVKFCKMLASIAGVSKNFRQMGVPALLVYKNGQLIGNFVRLSEELGDDFFADDVESFLREHAMLPDKACIPSIIKSQEEDDDDSDMSLE